MIHIPKSPIQIPKTEKGNRSDERFPSENMAEWTGLEPATPGVTGRRMDSALARQNGEIDIPKFSDSDAAPPLAEFCYSKESPSKTGGPPPALMQDDDGKLFGWFAGRLDARQRVREAVAAITQGERT